MRKAAKSGFTLIEMSIVLVVIGLVVGGVLVGQDLIRAAYIRAQISQIEKFNTAVNTFYGKYQALPGDMNASTATLYGFASRGQFAGEGDGNGILGGSEQNAAGYNYGGCACGEAIMFWVDLSSKVAGNLIEGGYTAYSDITSLPNPASVATFNQYLPTAKLGSGNFVYVYSGGNGYPPTYQGTGKNYYGIAATYQFSEDGFNDPGQSVGLTVVQAYKIDLKIDDGYPQSGNATAQLVDFTCGDGQMWASGNSCAYGAAPGTAAAASTTSCYDNGGNAANPMTYSMGISRGSGLNCALSFKMQ